MGITGDEILRARGREVTRPPREEPETALPPENESETIESGSKGGTDVRNRQGRPVLATEKL